MMSLNFQKKSKCYGNQTQCLRFAGQSIYDHKVQRHGAQKTHFTTIQ